MDVHSDPPSAPQGEERILTLCRLKFQVAWSGENLPEKIPFYVRCRLPGSSKKDQKSQEEVQVRNCKRLHKGFVLEDSRASSKNLANSIGQPNLATQRTLAKRSKVSQSVADRITNQDLGALTRQRSAFTVLLPRKCWSARNVPWIHSLI